MTETPGTDSPGLVIIDMQTIFSQYPKWCMIGYIKARLKAHGLPTYG
jgi:hypothetical protein